MDPEVIIIGDDNVEHVFPAGFDPKRAATIVRQQTSAAPTTGKGPQDVAPATAKPSPAERTWGDTITDALPAIGATIGGIAGGSKGLPTGALAAGIGGAAGSGYQQLINHAKEIPGAVVDIVHNLLNGNAKATLGGFVQGAKEGALAAGEEGLTQSALDLGGGIAGKAVIRPAAEAVTKFAFRPTRQALKTAPNLVRDILDNSIPLSEKGLAKAEARTGASRAVADKMVEDLENAPNRWLNDPNLGTFGSKRATVQGELIDPVFNTVRKGSNPNAVGAVEQRALRQGGRKTLANAEEDLIASNPREVGPKRLHEIKRAEGAAAGRIWTQSGEKQALKGKIAADIHNAADDALSRRLGPKFGEANAETQRRLMVQKTVEDALGASAAESHVPNAYDQFLLMRGLATGNPVDTAIAVAREAGRFRRGMAAFGRGVNQVQAKRLPTEAVRYGRELIQEDETNADIRRKQNANRTPAKKAQVDALYEKYSQR